MLWCAGAEYLEKSMHHRNTNHALCFNATCTSRNKGANLCQNNNTSFGGEYLFKQSKSFSFVCVCTVGNGTSLKTSMAKPYQLHHFLWSYTMCILVGRVRATMYIRQNSYKCITNKYCVVILSMWQGYFYDRKSCCHLSMPIRQFAMQQALKNES